MINSYLISLLYSTLIAVVAGMFLVIFSHQFLGLFANDKAVIDAGVDRLVIMASCYWLSAAMDCTTAATRALGKTVVPTIIMILGSCVFRIVWIYTVFAAFGTTTSIYLLYGVSWLITGIPEVIYFIYIYRKTVHELNL